MIGLSDKNDLLKTWEELTDNNDMSVIWDLKKDKHLLKKYNIINIKNFLTGDENIGHWIMFYVNPDLCYYYDPYGIVVPTEFLNELGLDAIASNVRIDQTAGESCGYYCICEAYNIFNKLASDSYIIIRFDDGTIDGDINKKIYDQHVNMLPHYYNKFV